MIAIAQSVYAHVHADPAVLCAAGHWEVEGSLGKDDRRSR